jgi:4-hydroxymandelate oxidase
LEHAAIWRESERLARVTPQRGGNGVLSRAVSLGDFESLAQASMAAVVWENFAAGSADDITLRWNREAFDRQALRPRFLGQGGGLSTCVTLLGQRLAYPIMLAPAGFQRVLHPRGELESAEGAALRSTAMVVSSLSMTPIEEIARGARTPLWFQLYIERDRSFTKEQIDRAMSAGCRALCVTVDTPNSGPRNRVDRAFCAPLRPSTVLSTVLAKQRYGLPTPHAKPFDADDRGKPVTWTDIEWLRSVTALPIVLKGILHPQDAAEAVQQGIDGLIVSNHGGRNLDTSIAAVDALPDITQTVGGSCVILLDGGVRRGTDVIKALALGARAVLIGRPYLYGLHVGGAAGVARVLEILQSELKMAMALTGQTDASRISADIICSAGNSF